MCNSIRMELYKIFRMRSFWVISIIMIGLVFMTTEFNCDDMKAARQEQSCGIRQCRSGKMWIESRAGAGFCCIYKNSPGKDSCDG